MKKWAPLLTTMVAIVIGILWGSYKVSQKEQNTERAHFFINVMNDVSQQWKLPSLSQLMLPRALEGSEAEYAAMLENASGLGKFLECDPLKLGEFQQEAFSREPFSRFDINTAYSANGVCEFEGGKALVVVGFFEVGNEQELVLFVVDNVELSKT